MQIQNKAYYEKMTAAIAETVIKTSLLPDGKTSTLMSGEVATACVDTLAFVLASSDAASTPAKLRRLSEEVAKSLREKIKSVQELDRAGGMDWLTVVGRADRH